MGTDPRLLEYSALQRAAEAEASSMAVGRKALRGRELVEGWAIDPEGAQVIDEAASATRRPDGDYDLHVSIADGSLLADMPAILELGARTLKADGPLRPMFPRELSENKLSLLDGVLRPVILFSARVAEDGTTSGLEVSQAKIAAKRITYDQFDAILADKDHPSQLAMQHIYEVAKRLSRVRRGAMAELVDIDLDEESGQFSANKLTAGHRVVQEIMVAASALAGQFFKGRQRPAIYRVHALNKRVKASIFPPSLHPLFARAHYSTTPRGHLDLELDDDTPYASVTSPLRKFTDLANHLNLAGVLLGSGERFSTQELDAIVRRYDQQSDFYRTFGKPQHDLTVIDGATKLVPTSRIRTKINNGTASQRDLADVLFRKPRGDMGILNETRILAAEYIARHPELALATLYQALGRKQAMIRPSENTHPDSQVVKLIRRGGEIGKCDFVAGMGAYPQAVEIATAFGKIVGIDVEVATPERLDPEKRLLFEGAHRHIIKLSGSQLINFGVQARLAQGGGVTVAMSANLGDGRRTLQVASGRNRDRAAQKAAVQIITELDLINNPPTIKVPKRTSKKPDANAAGD